MAERNKNMNDFENPPKEGTETEEERKKRELDEKIKGAAEFMKTGGNAGEILSILDNPEELEKLKKRLKSEGSKEEE